MYTHTMYTYGVLQLHIVARMLYQILYKMCEEWLSREE